MDISIIIPTLNRASLLQLTLQSIAEQEDINGSFEVIVIDNGSTDHTKAVCDEFILRVGHLTYCYDSVPGQLTGRHKGLSISRGSILSYLDDDVQLNSAWLKSLYEISQAHPEISIFGGPSKPRYRKEQPLWLNHFWEPTPYGGTMCLPLSLIDLEAGETIVDPLFVFGLNFSIRKDKLMELKGFHPDCIPATLQRFQGDGETGLAIKAGMNKVKALHASRLSLYHQITDDRLTAEYFQKWSYYNGVCQSFTDLRYTNRLYVGSGIKQPKKGLLKNIKSFATRISGRIFKKNKSKTTDFFRKIEESYRQGYAFHQQAFATDKTVREWVLRNDYLDYNLPV